MKIRVSQETKWNEVAEIEIRGRRIVVKDAMIMLGDEETEPGWPFVFVDPGQFVVEIHLPRDWHCGRFRVRRQDSTPALGKVIGSLNIDHAKAAFIDYDTFHSIVCEDLNAYEEWTGTELDDELALNFSGQIKFGDTPLVYVKSGVGDGTYPVFELVENAATVGLECRFDTPSQ